MLYIMKLNSHTTTHSLFFDTIAIFKYQNSLFPISALYRTLYNNLISSMDLLYLHAPQINGKWSQLFLFDIPSNKRRWGLPRKSSALSGCIRLIYYPKRIPPLPVFTKKTLFFSLLLSHSKNGFCIPGKPSKLVRSIDGIRTIKITVS